MYALASVIHSKSKNDKTYPNFQCHESVSCNLEEGLIQEEHLLRPMFVGNEIYVMKSSIFWFTNGAIYRTEDSIRDKDGKFATRTVNFFP